MPHDLCRLAGHWSNAVLLGCRPFWVAGLDQIENLVCRAASDLGPQIGRDPALHGLDLVTIGMAPSTCRVGSAGFSRLARCTRNLVPTHAADFGPDLECLGPG